MLIRPAVASDLPDVARIYDREAREGHATFDLEGRPPEAWSERLAASGPGEHLLVAADDGGLVGWCSAVPYRPRPAYRLTRETTVYVAPAAQRRGVGRELYAGLLDRLAADGIHLAVAGVALPNDASRALHRSLGFEPLGVMREVGRKHDRWIDVEWWQRVVR